ncbi:DUF817 family protein [Nonomuraea endophytica]|uniref:DUF817 family protein n=1 Tax=Nonomuraea endophytica TaxID=714136 RepID=UPI0037C6780D
MAARGLLSSRTHTDLDIKVAELAQSLVLIGFFLWVAENIATYLGAWQYPYQRGTWQLVHPAQFGAWALLVSVTFVMVACWQGRQGRLHLRPPFPGRTRGWALPLRRLDGAYDQPRQPDPSLYG